MSNTNYKLHPTSYHKHLASYLAAFNCSILPLDSLQLALYLMEKLLSLGLISKLLGILLIPVLVSPGTAVVGIILGWSGRGIVVGLLGLRLRGGL